MIKTITQAILKTKCPIPVFSTNLAPEFLAHGVCYYYAYVMSSLLKDADLYTYYEAQAPVHAFFSYQGKYYNGSNPEGVDHWSHLQSYMRFASPDRVENQTKAKFCKEWFLSKNQIKDFNEAVLRIKKQVKTKGKSL